MLTLYVSLILIAVDSPQQQAETLKLDRSVSEWIEAVSSSSNVSKDEEVADLDRWLATPSIIDTLNGAMESGVNEAEVQRQVQRVVACVRHSSESAFRVYLQCYHHMQPNVDSFARTTIHPLDKMFAKAQVNLWCKHPEEVERMVWFVVWLNGPSKERLAMTLGTYISQLKSNISKSSIHHNAGEVWVYRRTFMVLACITGCSESYVGKKPTGVLEDSSGWLTRLSTAAKKGELEASGFSPSWAIRTGLGNIKGPQHILALKFVPSTPFPGWNKLPVGHGPKWFRDIY